MPNHPISIQMHEKSQAHIDMRNEILDNGGRRVKANILPAFQKQPEEGEENEQGPGGQTNKPGNQKEDRVDNLGYSKPKDDDNTFSIDQIKNDPGNG